MIYDNGFLNSSQQLQRDYELKVRGLSGKQWENYCTRAQIAKAVIAQMGNTGDTLEDIFGVDKNDLSSAWPLKDALAAKVRSIKSVPVCDICPGNHRNCPDCNPPE
jgi:NAD(P)H-nitrite reductase large subunit